MTEKTVIFEEVKELILEEVECDPNDIHMKTHIQNDLEADSLDLFAVINQIEIKYKIKIDDNSLISTVEELVIYIEKNKEG